jgi:hypothetical protein
MLSAQLYISGKQVTCSSCVGVKLGSLILREEHSLRVFENRVPRRIFVPKREEVAGY